MSRPPVWMPRRWLRLRRLQDQRPLPDSLLAKVVAHADSTLPRPPLRSPNRALGRVPSERGRQQHPVPAGADGQRLAAGEAGTSHRATSKSTSPSSWLRRPRPKRRQRKWPRGRPRRSRPPPERLQPKRPPPPRQPPGRPRLRSRRPLRRRRRRRPPRKRRSARRRRGGPRSRRRRSRKRLRPKLRRKRPPIRRRPRRPERRR